MRCSLPTTTHSKTCRIMKLSFSSRVSEGMAAIRTDEETRNRAKANRRKTSIILIMTFAMVCQSICVMLRCPLPRAPDPALKIHTRLYGQASGPDFCGIGNTVGCWWVSLSRSNLRSGIHGELPKQSKSALRTMG